MVPLVTRPIILFVAIAAAAIALVAAALAGFLAVVLVADLLCKLSHVFLHGLHAHHERAAFFHPSLGRW